LAAVQPHQTISHLWPNEAACAAHAAQLAHHSALGNAFIELVGTLGAGKTTFTRHLLQALGVQGRIKSPTYGILEAYEVAQRQFWHFDFYRFNDPQEWEDAGFRDIFAGPGLKLVEWPDKAAGLLPQADVRIHLEPLPDEQRRALFTAHTALGLTLLS
jgi:tRNA threonylcarbamoyladenosine biosynthesis protein TsaE